MKFTIQAFTVSVALLYPTPVDQNLVKTPAQGQQIAWRGRFEVEFGARRGDRVAYGGGLENRFRLFGERGFESHPLRHLDG